jgi:hypothetical protein
LSTLSVANITGQPTSNLGTINVGANVVVNTTSISVGNLSVNTTSISVGNSSVNTAHTATGITFSDASQMGSASSLGMRNRIINGGMSIDQRNSGASSNTNGYNLDRWIAYFAGGNLSSQRVGSAGSYSWQLTGASGISVVQLIQRIEAVNIADLAGQSVTLSLTVSSSSLTTVSFYAQTPTAVDNYNGTNTGVLIGSPTISSTPTRFSYTFTMPSTATNGVQIIIQSGAFTSGTLTITNVQLEQGSVATPFERRPYGMELMLCQRYYQISSIININSYGGQYASGPTAFYGAGVPFAVPMRATPTATYQYISGNQYWVIAGTGAYSAASSTGLVILLGTTGWSLYQTRQAGNAVPTSGNYYIFESAFNILASAEL